MRHCQLARGLQPWGRSWGVGAGQSTQGAPGTSQDPTMSSHPHIGPMVPTLPSARGPGWAPELTVLLQGAPGTPWGAPALGYSFA